jgi:hypothetical protein
MGVFVMLQHMTYVVSMFAFLGFIRVVVAILDVPTPS